MHDLETRFRTLEARHNTVAEYMGRATVSVDFFSHDAFYNFFVLNGLYSLVQTRVFGGSPNGFERWRSYMCPDPYDYGTWSQYTASDWQDWQLSRYGFELQNMRNYLRFKPLEVVFNIADKILDDMTSVYTRELGADLSSLHREAGWLAVGTRGSYADILQELEADPWEAGSDQYVGWEVDVDARHRWTMWERWGDGATRTTMTNYNPYRGLTALEAHSQQLTPHTGWSGTFYTNHGAADLGTSLGMATVGFAPAATYDITAGITQAQLHAAMLAHGETSGESGYSVSNGYFTIIDFSTLL